MAKIVHHCPVCKKVAETASEFDFDGLIIKTYKCGHTETMMGVSHAAEDTLDIVSLDGCRPFKYQLEGARFIENGNGRVLIADEMALGKTVQFQMFVTAHPEVRPFAVFVKARLKVQWFREGVRWGDMMCQIVDGSKGELQKGFDGYIISYDSSWRMGKKAEKKPIYPGSKKLEMVYTPIEGKTLPEQLARCKVKTIGLDECQLIKNPESERTKTIQKCVEVETVNNVIGMSGTPIKNNASEYFTVLNMLRPDKFPNKNQFIMKWCESFYDGYKTKVGGIKNPAAFQDFTKDFIIRRTRAEVLPDLPSIFRHNTFSDLGDEVQDAYRKEMESFRDEYDDSGGFAGSAGYSNLMGYLSRMRHLTGLSKIDPVCDAVEEFIMSTDRKLAIFTHHIDVADLLKLKLSKMAQEWPAEWGKGILSTVGVAAEKCTPIIEQWQSPDYRICILGTLASGEGLNLQFCADCVMMERQWNPANEEQAEARFPRPGQTADKINSTYHTAVGTVDEFFAQLVEQKRAYMASTLDGKKMKWDESSLVRELADILRQKGGKAWGW